MAVHVAAEIGSNWCGSLDLALAHIRAAKECGADSVKFQLFRAESLESDPVKQAKRKPYELPLEWLPILKEECVKQGLQFGVTPFAVDLVEPLRGNVDYVKIAALDSGYDDLIKSAAGLGVPMVISVAGITESKMHDLLALIYEECFNCDSVTLLWGVTHYPALPEEMNMKAMSHLLDEFGFLVGLSDHTIGYEAAIVATSLEASHIEKHFSLSLAQYPQLLKSPDCGHSLEPHALAIMVSKIRMVEKMLGTGKLNGPNKHEKALHAWAKRSNEKPLRG